MSILFSSSSRSRFLHHRLLLATRRMMTTKATNETTTTISSNVLCFCALVAATTTATTIAIGKNNDSKNDMNQIMNRMTVTNISLPLQALQPNKTYCDINMNIGTPVKEKATGIMFPQLCNGFQLAGTGARYKWGMIQVYAVGTYLDTIAMDGIKKSGSKKVMEDALLNPDVPRTIRIVFARNLSIKTFMDGIVESIKPRLNGQELEKLDEFKKLNAQVDLIKGAVIEMTIRGETLLYKDATGQVGMLYSKHFNKALCDVYYGQDNVSSTHKQSVLDGIPKL